MLLQTADIFRHSVDRQTHTSWLHIVCVCDTALLQIDSLICLIFLKKIRYVRRENIAPFISLLLSSNAMSYTYQVNTVQFKATFNLKQWLQI